MNNSLPSQNLDDQNPTLDKKIIESNTSFSQSVLWRWQRDFFIREGISAWDNQVPFYITSNPSIADSYANVMIRFMQDCYAGGKYKKGQPFYIVELGSGTGRFAFYVIKRLFELQKNLALEDINFVYVVTDLAQENIDFCLEHSAFRDFIEAGIVDFSCFDIENDVDLTLQLSGEVVRQNNKDSSSENPYIFIANYVFDCLPHDIFRVQDNTLYEVCPVVEANTEHIIDNKVKNLNQLDIGFSYHSISENYYQDEDYDYLLNIYKDQPNGSYLLFPIGGLRCLEKLKRLSDGRYLMLAADKADVELSQLARNYPPDIRSHGNGLFMQVNFHSIMKYIQHNGGDFYYAPVQTGISSLALLSANLFEELPEAQQATKTYLGSQSPAVIFNLYAYIRDTMEDCPVETFLALITISHYDPHIFDKYINVLLENISSLNDTTRLSLESAIPKIADNFYYMPNTNDTLENIALFFMEISNQQAALDYYQRSVALFGEEDHICYNMGLCLYELGNVLAAAKNFARALQLNPGLTCAQEMLGKIEERSHRHH